MSEIYDNAIDSLRIGMESFVKEATYSTRKHAILTIFHAIELLLKECLAQTNPVLIYKNIDTKITDDSPTVGAREALMRLENIGLKIPPDEKKTIERIQQIRNRIEHHRYDHAEEENNAVIASSLKFILYFVEFILKRRLDVDIDGALLRNINHRVLEYNERQALAEHRFREWAHETWPEWDEQVDDSPEKFEGTLPCPECRQDWLVIGYHHQPTCFHCNTTIDADACEDCGEVFLIKRGCGCGSHKGEDDGKVTALLDQMRGEAIRKREEALRASKSGLDSKDE